MIYGSVCSGIEAASAAWGPLNWQAAWFSEIEKFPSQVLAHHHPDVPNLGDMTKLQESEVFNDTRIDVLVGGTPCQSFSVAGLRAGLDDARGNLALVFCQIARRKRPRWMVWENVPGVLSSKGGSDFGSFLSGLAGWDIPIPEASWQNSGVINPAPGGYGLAWRVLDAQYFGVPQRRRRVFVVGYFGDWRPAAAVLFERQSLSGDSPPSRKTGQGPAHGFETGPGGGRETDLAPTMDARSKDGPRRNHLGVGVMETARSLRGQANHSHRADSDNMVPEVAGTLKGGQGTRGYPDPSDGNGGGLIPGVAPTIGTRYGSQAGQDMEIDGALVVGAQLTGHGFWKESDQAGVIRSHADNSNNLVAQSPVVLEDQGGSVMNVNESGVVGSLRREAHGHEPLVFENHPQDSRITQVDQAPAITGRAGTGGGNLPLVAIPLDLRNALRDSDKHEKLQQGTGIGEAGDPANTVTSAFQPAVAFQSKQSASSKSPSADGVAPTLDVAKAGGTAVAFQQNSRSEVREIGGDGAIVGALASEPGMQQQNFVAQDVAPVAFTERGRGDGTQIESQENLSYALRDSTKGGGRLDIAAAMQVRRLTPRECERLQGFPDDYTLIPINKKGKMAADGPRYKALGNSMAVVVMSWIGKRIQAVEDLINGR